MTAVRHEIEVELDEQGFLKLVRDSSGNLKPKTRFTLEIKDENELGYTRIGTRYAKHDTSRTSRRFSSIDGKTA